VGYKIRETKIKKQSENYTQKNEGKDLGFDKNKKKKIEGKI
jgi:hypothetical protein